MRLKHILNHFGYEFRRVPKEHIYQVNAYFDQKALLHSRKIKVIFDLGANIGQSVSEYNKLFPNANIYAFEPFNDAFSVLYNTYKSFDSIKPYKLALTDTTGSKPFFFNKANYTNSLLKIAADSSKYVAQDLTDNLGFIDVDTITIDDFCQREHINKIQILKMDIQGGELMALQGATKLLSNQSIDLVYTEVLFAKLYEKQANFYNLCELLEQYGYVLYGLYNLNYARNGVLAWGDAIFISPIIEQSLKEIM